jgi:hypothetical protein
MDAISIYIDVQICMFSYILQLICLSACFFEYKQIYIYTYITDASETLRFRGFLENDASHAPASLGVGFLAFCTMRPRASWRNIGHRIINLHMLGNNFYRFSKLI